jgi:hypothetical protein
MRHSQKHDKLPAVALNGLRGSFDESELRKEERFLAERSIEAIVRGQNRDLWLVDCSIHGLQLVCNTDMSASEQFCLIVPLQGKPIQVKYEVRYLFKLWADTFQIGAALIESFDPEQEQWLLRELLGDKKH